MAVDIQSMIIQQYMKELFKDPKEKEIDALRLKALRQGQSPSQAYKTNIDKMAGDYKTSIDLDALGTRKTELEAYRKDRLTKDKNILPTTIDYIDNVIADIDKRTVTTASFNTSIDELANIENSLDAIVKSYMNPKATAEDKSSAIDKLKKINVSRMDISTKLQSYDRNRYLRDNNLRLLDADMKMKGAFAIDAIHSDKLMDNHEYSVWQNAIYSDNPDIIKQYYLEQSTFKHESGKDMIEGFGTAGTSTIEAYNNWKESETAGMPSETQRKMKDDFNVTKNYLYTLKGQMEESMGIGKVNTMWNQIFPDDVPWLKEPSKKKKVKLPGEGLPGEPVVLPEEDVSRFEKGFKEYAEMDWRGNLPGGKKPSFKQHDKIIFKEFEKAKERDASLTMSDFMSHRADIYNKWKEKDDTYKESKEKGEVSRLEKGRLTKEELKLWRTDLGKLKDNSLRKFFWQQGTHYGSTGSNFKSVDKKIDGKNIRFLLERSRQGRLKVSKQLQNPYTGKFDKVIESSIEEFNKSV